MIPFKLSICLLFFQGFQLCFSTYAFQSTKEIVISYGYECEEHEVTVQTELRGRDVKVTIFRILPPKNTPKNELENRKVVILQHGFLGSSSDYVFAGKESGLGFYLCDKGFDVWLTNARGNIFGRQYVKEMKKAGKAGDRYADENIKNFWDYSFHEIGIYDLPAQIDFVLEKTNKEKLFLVGFSMGTTASYVMLSEKPEYNEKIERMVNLAPVAYLHNSKVSLTAKMTALSNTLWGLFRRDMAARKFEYPRKAIPLSSKPICFGIMERLCDYGLNCITTTRTNRLDSENRRKKFYEVMPAGVSWKTATHFLQIKSNKQFAPFKYHLDVWNEERYWDQGGHYLYNLTHVVTPRLLILAEKDALSTKEDTKLLTDNWKDNFHVTYVTHVDFTHYDFFVAKDVRRLVFDVVGGYLMDGSVPKETARMDYDGWNEEQARKANSKLKNIKKGGKIPNTAEDNGKNGGAGVEADVEDNGDLEKKISAKITEAVQKEENEEDQK